MLLKLYKGTGFGVIFLLLITAIGLWLGPILKPQLPVYYTGVNTMPLFTMVRNFIGENARAGVLISLALVILTSLLLANFNLTGILISDRTFLPAALFIILSAVLPVTQTLNPGLFATVFLLLALIRIIDSYRKNGTANNFFDAALLISIGSLFYVDLIWMELLVFLGMILLRTLNIKEVAISIVGILTPYLILYGTYYSLGKDINDLNTLILSNVFGESGSIYLSRIVIVTLIMAGLFVSISIFHLFSVLNAKKIRSRKSFSLLLWIFVLAIVSFVFLPSVSSEIIYIIAIPVSYLISHYCFFLKKKYVPGIFFTVILALTIILQILYYQ